MPSSNRTLQNLPIGGIAMAVILFFLRIKRDSNPTGASILARVLQLDLLGTAILIPCVVCLLLALQWGGAEYPWNDSRIIGLFVGFALMAILFTVIQLREGDKGTLPPRLFKNRNVLCAMLFAFFFGAAFFSIVYYLCTSSSPVCPLHGHIKLTFAPAALYFQAINGDSAVTAGLKLLPLLIATVLSSMLSGGIVTAIGYYNPVILPSMVLFSVGSGLITTFSLDTPIRQWFGYQVIAGLGVGVGFQSGVLVVQTVLPLDWVPVGTACVQFFQSLGGALFIAVAQTVFQNGLIDGINRDAPDIDPTIFINAGASQVRNILAQLHLESATNAVLTAYLQGLRNTYYITAACAAAAFVAALGLDWKTIKKNQGGDDEPAKKDDVEAAQAVKVDEEGVKTDGEEPVVVTKTEETPAPKKRFWQRK